MYHAEAYARRFLFEKGQQVLQCDADGEHRTAREHALNLEPQLFEYLSTVHDKRNDSCHHRDD